MKSRNCLVVNWNRVESLRDRSKGSIIGILSNNDHSGIVAQLVARSADQADFFNTRW